MTPCFGEMQVDPVTDAFIAYAHDRLGPAALFAGVVMSTVRNPLLSNPFLIILRYLRSQIAMLRHKFEADPSEPHRLRSEPGVGNRLVA